MRYRYIFWDFNGTIIDDVRNSLGCVNDLLDRKNRPHITLDDYYNYVETPIIGFYRHILPPEEINFDEISKAFHEDYGKRIVNTRLADGAYELMHSLKEQGVHQYIVTSNHIDEVTDLVKRFGIYDCVEKILGADNTLSESKTQRAKELFDSLNINRNDAVFIGDTLHDLETANTLGIDYILVEYGHQGKKLLRSFGAYTVADLKGVEKILYDERRVDFHTHSTRSDGTMTPAELVQHAKNVGLSAFALTDHDSVDGIEEAQNEAEKIGVEFIPGIEFSAAEETEIHIIGLYIDPTNETLLKTINKLKNSRKRRMEDICRKLRSLGFEITHDEALLIGGGHFVGRAHIAKLMVQKGYCNTVQECFDKYIGLGKPAYSEKNELTATEAVESIRAAGGLAFLAHPHQTKYNLNQLEELLLKLKAVGLNGLEGYYSEYTPEHIADYRLLAQKLKLAFSGGSDFHGAMKPHIAMGTGKGNLNIPYYVLDNIKDIKNSQNS